MNDKLFLCADCWCSGGEAADHRLLESSVNISCLFVSNLQHDCLVQLYGLCEKPDLLIVTEFMEGGKLYAPLISLVLCYRPVLMSLLFIQVHFWST